MNKINVLVVDDSAVVRQVLTNVLGADPDIKVDAAGDPIFAMRRMEKLWPDVIILDVEMPRMDGITFLKKIMKEHPTPVVMCSTLTEKGAETTMEALAAGAVDIVTKPKVGVKGFFNEEAASLIEAVKAAAASRMGHWRELRKLSKGKGWKNLEEEINRASEIALAKTTAGLVAMGTSTGGTQALELVLQKLPRLSPGIVVVQHMPEKFTAAFAARLNHICEVEVLEAKDGEKVIPGRVLIAPGGRHMQLRRSGARYYVEISDGPPVSRHRPSVDVLFRSVAKAAGSNAMGVIMTGMGDDGASGLLTMRQEGGLTIAQDEQSCIVYGMPNEAVKRGAVVKTVSLENISAEILRFAKLHEVSAKAS